jgi:cytohesin
VSGRPDIIEAKDVHWWTLLHVIAHDSNFISAGWLYLLIDGGADIEARTISDETPLHIASQANSRVVATFLIEREADIEARTSSGQTPLHNAASYGSLEVARLLIDGGARIDTEDDAGRTPLHSVGNWADDPRHSLDVARLLIDHGANTENIDLSWMN